MVVGTSADTDAGTDAAPRRVLVRGLTIDDRATRDIDDAIWIEPAGDGWRVWVTIADVSRFVDLGDDADQAAYARAETRYFATGNSPMLPRALSEDACSLWPAKVRRTVTVDLTLAADLSAAATTLYRSRLRSLAKLSYGEIPGVLQESPKLLRGGRAARHAMLTAAAKVAFGLLERRRQAGALVLYDLNEGWVTTEEGHLRRVARREDTVGQIIVQEFMILANAAVAQYAVAHDIPVPFRNHRARAAAPDRAVLAQQLSDACTLQGATLDRLRDQVRLVFCRAEYGAGLEGHYGLNLPAYLHFTSPIRRYADLVTHRQIVAHLRGDALPYDRAAIAAVCAHLNARLRANDDAQSEAMKARATDRATAAVESRRVHGLGPKEFERVVKVVARAGGAPPDGFAEAVLLRLADGRVPLLCQTVLLGEAPATPPWDALRDAILARLVRHPEDAISILAQCAAVLGWPAADYVHEESGPSHARTFQVIASVGDVVTDPVAAPTLRGGKQRAAVAALARKLGRPLPTEPAAAPAPVAAKNAVSFVQEHAQRHAVPPPGYVFAMAGPPHLPVVRCTCTYRGLTTTGAAANKQEAKRLAAEAMQAQLAEVSA